MSFKLDLPPPRVPVLTSNGAVNPVWYRFFTAISKRLGVSTQDLIEGSQTEAEAALAVAQQAVQLANEAQTIGNQAINDAGAAQVVADNALISANEKAKVFGPQGTAPTADKVGDFWIDNSVSYELKQWDGATWQLV